MNLREKFINLLREEGISCDEQIIKPFRGTVWAINNRKSYITYLDSSKAWYQVPASVLDLVEVLIFIVSGDPADVPKPLLISTQDFRPLVNALGEPPIDGAFNVHITRFEWPNIDLRVSLGDRSESARYSLEDGGVIFDSFELLEKENGNPKITEALRRVEALISQ